jgi:hypothetical protein
MVYSWYGSRHDLGLPVFRLQFHHNASTMYIQGYFKTVRLYTLGLLLYKDIKKNKFIGYSNVVKHN